MLTSRKPISNTVIEERCPYERSTDMLISPFLSTRLCSCHSFRPCLNVTPSLRPRDDNFSDSLSQKADSEASSGHAGEDKCSGKDIGSPTDTRISEAYIARLV